MLTPTGNSYEKSAILEWIKKNGTDPISRKPLKAEDLIPNLGLKNVIESFQKKDSKPIVEKEKEKMKVEQVVAINKEISLSALAKKNRYGDVSICVKTMIPDSAVPQGIDLCLCLDVSGSMGSVQSIKNENGKSESDGLTALDIVKHASKTVINSLTENDRISIVVFSTGARKIFDWQYMTDDFKKAASLCIENQRQNGSTYLWHAIQKSVECLQSSRRRCVQKKIFLLTDGCPTENPPMGYAKAMNKLLLKSRQHDPSFSFTMSTFGFGYSLKSDLLYDLAKSCGGTYSFIPDASMVGTNFVNSIASLRSVFRSQAKVEIAVSGSSEKQTIDIGDLYVGRTRDIVIPIKKRVLSLMSKNKTKDSGITIKLLVDEKKIQELVLTNKDIGATISPSNTQYLNDQLNRTMFYMQLKAFCENPTPQDQQKFINNLKKNICVENASAYTKALMKEITGEVTLATSEKNWKRWGRHYLPSLSRNHEMQVCSNFKDIAIQFYTSDLFEKLRDQGDDIFLSMPPPKPSTYTFRGQKCRNGAPPPPVAMANYYNQSYGCFAGKNMVLMKDRALKRCDQIQKGDEVLTEKGTLQRIKCIVRTDLRNDGGKGKNIPLIRVGDDLIATPYHPIKVNGRWRFPIDVGSRELFDMDFVYSFLLEEGESMVIEGITCITYNHNIQNDPVATHNFFGTQKVVENLMKFNGFDKGLVTIKGVCRDPITGLIESFE